MFYYRYVVYSAATGQTFTYFLSDQGYQLRRDGGTYPPDWVALFYKHFPSFNESLVNEGLVSEEIYRLAETKAPKLILKGEYQAHDLSHLEMFTVEEQDDHDDNREWPDDGGVDEPDRDR